MSGNFSWAYAELTDFIANHSEIEIGESVTSIPENVRTDFYARFNSARNAFVEEKFPEFLSKAARLQEEYAKATEEAAASFSLEDTPAINSLRRFLRDPMDSLARELFDPLFDLLKKRETLQSFEQRASTAIDGLFPILYRGAYDKWVILSLAMMFDIKTALRIPVRELQPSDRAKSATFAPVEEVPSPVESTSFYFSQPLKTIFAVPDLILHSARLNRFVGIRSEFREGICHAPNASGERDWYPADADLLRLLANGLSLIYVAENPESISLIADVARFCRPDIVLWCIDSGTTSREEAIKIMAIVEERLRPVKGSYVVATESWPTIDNAVPSPALETQGDGVSSGIAILTAGFDRSKLDPIIDALHNKEDAAIAT